MNSPSTVKSMRISLSSKGNTDIIDITTKVQDIISSSAMQDGIICLFVIGSTAGLTTIEYEPGLVKDIEVALEKIAPRDGLYEHHKTWGDDNGNSHIRASLIGPSLTVPFTDKKLILGTWQQIIFLDFDTRPRSREIVAQLIGA